MKIKKSILDLVPYPPGKPIEELTREYGIKQVIKLASNENPLGPSPLALKAIRRVLAPASSLSGWKRLLFKTSAQPASGPISRIKSY